MKGQNAALQSRNKAFTESSANYFPIFVNTVGFEKIDFKTYNSSLQKRQQLNLRIDEYYRNLEDNPSGLTNPNTNLMLDPRSASDQVKIYFGAYESIVNETIRMTEVRIEELKKVDNFLANDSVGKSPQTLEIIQKIRISLEDVIKKGEKSLGDLKRGFMDSLPKVRRNLLNLNKSDKETQE